MIELSDCQIGAKVWYRPSLCEDRRFAGEVIEEPRMLGETPVVRLKMDQPYVEWHHAHRTTIPAAALFAIELRETPPQ